MTFAARCPLAPLQTNAVRCSRPLARNRSLVFPFRIRSGRPTPAVICLMASAFCAYNGLLQVVCMFNMLVLMSHFPHFYLLQLCGCIPGACTHRSRRAAGLVAAAQTSFRQRQPH
jgi:hypothetical protein